ncbi:uncharacterized protein [Parasteatoda tepidariorum]|uniref:uncharacterized protein n=1 Tax=Parasteatoda tepidariorum TaxID=114398 RepID=UPI00077F8B8E|nr:uncharacterized protein LOC107454178 isoform X2 [Parasteatoda tepidariorum]
MASFGQSSLYIFISVFGGSTLLLFLICFCCQRKLQKRTLAMADITSIESQRRRQGASRTQRRSDLNQLITDGIKPPPDYNDVLKKDSLCEAGLPTYDVAIQGLRSDNYV